MMTLKTTFRQSSFYYVQWQVICGDRFFLRTSNFSVHFLAPDDVSLKEKILPDDTLGFCGSFPESLFSFMKALGQDFSSLS
jgi:hypothetical protein